MKKITRSLVIAVLLALLILMSQACAQQSDGSISTDDVNTASDTVEEPQKSDLELVNDYLDNLGYKTIKQDLVASMQDDTSHGKTAWDILVEYVKTGVSPDGIQITITDGSIEIRSKQTE
jgi:hypothetical protein